MNIKEMSNEELLNYYEDYNQEEYKAELLSRLAAGEKAIAELKTAKLDSARLIVQEEMYESLKCCGNCKKYQSGSAYIENNFWNNYCGRYQSDQLTRSEREAK